MSGPPGELMIRKNIIVREWHQNSLTYGHVTKLFLAFQFQHKKEINKRKRADSQKNLVVFSAGIHSEK